MAKNKERLDILIVQRGLAESRAKAQALIMAGDVYVDGKKVEKAGTLLDITCNINIKPQNPFVSRGGQKLAGALNDFDYDVEHLICADVGASTGGFTDCLLQRGASKVYAIDVGYGQLAHKLRIDERVVVLERTNARYVETLNELADLVVIDASFISLRLLLPAITQWLKEHGDVIALIKPQFEAGKRDVGKGGVVRDANVHRRVVEDVSAFAHGIGLRTHRITVSPIKGPSGNVEFLIWLTKQTDLDTLDIEKWVEEHLA